MGVRSRKQLLHILRGILRGEVAVAAMSQPSLCGGGPCAWRGSDIGKDMSQSEMGLGVLQKVARAPCAQLAGTQYRDKSYWHGKGQEVPNPTSGPCGFWGWIMCYMTGLGRYFYKWS